MGKVAVLYATGMTKNTKRLAEYIAARTGGDSFNLKEMTSMDLSGYDTLVFGTGIHAGRPYKPVVEYLQRNRAALEGKKTVLFISCMYNDEKGDRQCEAVAQQMGFQHAVYFNKKADEMNDAGFPKAVDEFAEGLR